jgi:hypothetical protein
MKLFTTITATFLYLSTWATTYYVDATSGLDSNNGTSTATAWKTIAKVNSAALKAGDFVLFKRGEEFRGYYLNPKSGSPSGNITYGAYGTGAKPKLLGSYKATNTSIWSNVEGNIWRCKIPASYFPSSWLPNDVGNIIFNNEEFCGVKVLNASGLNAQGKYWSDINANTVDIYSVSNPATFYTNIELAINRHMVDQGGKSYITYENLDLRYIGAHGFAGSDVNHVWLKDLDISYIGGGLQKAGVRFGNGIELWESGNNITVERCRIDQCYDAAITPQGTNASTVFNLYYRNNIISNSEYSFEFFEYSGNSNTHDIYFENNTCINAGGGFGHNQRPDSKNGAHLMFWGFSGQSSNFIVRNNIFINSTERGALVGNNINKYTFDNNCWYDEKGMAMKIGNTTYNLPAKWNSYKTDSGQDANSIYTDPLLTPDYFLSAGSPCVDKGFSSPLVTSDFIGTLRPQGIGWDIGAYEFNPTSSSSETNFDKSF